MIHRYQILSPSWIVTVNQRFEVVTDHALVIKDQQIDAIVPNSELADLPCYEAAEKFDLPGQVLMPGLVNSHTHASMSLFRGMADDLELMNWLNNHIWPAENRWVDAEFIRHGFELAAAEMIRSGTTCLNDMYFYPDVVARCAQQIGIRTVVGLIVLDFPSVWAKNADEYLHKALEIHDEIRDYSLVTSALAPHAPYTVSDEPLQKIAMYSNELELPVHMHIHETAFEVAEAEKRYGKRPLDRLDQLNLLNPNLIAVHMTDLNPFEIERIGEAGAHVVHCPESNMKLASGFCPVNQLLENKVNVCLGTDSAASNNNLDMFTEMKTAALLAKLVSRDASACDARQMIRLATINGAKALGLENSIGSLEPAKLADIIAVDLSDINTQPVYDPVAQLVYATNSRQVSHVWIDGACLLRDHKLSNLDEKSVKLNAQTWARKIKVSDSELNE